MDPIALLKAQHRAAETLLVQVDQLSGAQRWDAFHELAHALLLHAQLEEDAFYPEIRTAQTEDLVSASFDEHGEVRKIITRLAGLRPDSKEFQATLVDLKAAVDAHVAEEEGELFPELAALLPQARLLEIGEAMQRRRQELEAPDALPVFDQPPPLV